MKFINQERLLAAIERIMCAYEEELKFIENCTNLYLPKTFNLTGRLFRYTTRHAARLEKIHEIQLRHNVSGLVQRELRLENFSFRQNWAHQDLVLLPADMEILNREKPKVATFFVEYATSKGLSMQMMNEVWTNVPCDRALVALPFYEWAQTWEETYFLSPSRINRRGYDTPRGEAFYPDDVKHRRSFLELGRGSELDAPDASIWFRVQSSTDKS